MAEHDREDNDLYSKIKSLIVARLLIGTTLLMGAAIPFEISEVYSASRFLFPLVTIILVLTILYSSLLNLIENLIFLAYLQLAGDIVLSSLIIIATGGIESPFTILLVLVIIIASYMVEKKGTYTITVLSIVAFGFIAINQYQEWTFWYSHWLRKTLRPTPSFAVYIILVNLIGFFLTAILANNLSDRIRKMNLLLKAKNIQFSYLWTLNRRIVNEMQSGLITLTKEGDILSVNPAARQMLKRFMDDKNQLTLDDLFPEYLGQSILRISEMEKGAKRQITYQFEYENETIWLMIDVVILQRKAHDPARLMLILTDISEHKKLEEIQRKAQRWSVVSEISASMAHEIRNPLTSISGSIEILKEQLQMTESQSKLMSIVIKESDRLNKMITDFLSLAKPGNFDFKLVDIVEILNEVVLLIEASEAYQNSIEIILDIVQGPLQAELDKDQFTQVLWNLFKNACEAMPDGGKLKITAMLCTEPDLTKGIMDYQPNPPFLRLTIEDTGIGMSQTQVERIFDPFVTFKKKGVGVGLAVVYRILEIHDANIRVLSVPGKGTKISIDLPQYREGRVKADGKR
ncbi:MAG: ATP-binding protein [bacterium]